MAFNTPLLKGLLHARRMRQYHLARAVDITEGYMTKIMGGVFVPARPLVEKIAKFMGVKPEQLMIKNIASQTSASPSWSPRVRRGS